MDRARSAQSISISASIPDTWRSRPWPREWYRSGPDVNGAGHWWRWDSGKRMRAQELLHVHFVALPAHLERNLIGITALVEYHQNAVEAVGPRTQGHRETGSCWCGFLRHCSSLAHVDGRVPGPRADAQFGAPIAAGFARPRIRRPQVAGGGFPVWLRAWPRRSPGPGGVGRGIAAVVTPAADPEWSPSNRTEENAVGEQMTAL